MESLVTQQEAISLLFSKMPLGRIALSLAPPEKLKGTPSDLVLEDGDRLSVPKPPFTISVVGAVNNQGSVIYEPGKDLEWYIDNVGGYNKYADQRNSFIIHANGMADQRFTRLQKIRQGDTIFVPEQVRINRWSMTKDIFQMFYNFALPAAAFFK